MSAYEKTKYPKTFKNTYWGHFIVEENSNITEEIIENRNKFVEEFKIKKCNHVPRYVQQNRNENHMLDHVEYYQTKDNKNYVVISSPYENLKNQYKEKGWIETNKLYANTAFTFLKIFPKKNRKNQ